MLFQMNSIEDQLSYLNLNLSQYNLGDLHIIDCHASTTSCQPLTDCAAYTSWTPCYKSGTTNKFSIVHGCLTSVEKGDSSCFCTDAWLGMVQTGKILERGNYEFAPHACRWLDHFWVFLARVVKEYFRFGILQTKIFHCRQNKTVPPHFRTSNPQKCYATWPEAPLRQASDRLRPVGQKSLSGAVDLCIQLTVFVN